MAGKGKGTLKQETKNSKMMQKDGRTSHDERERKQNRR